MVFVGGVVGVVGVVGTDVDVSVGAPGTVGAGDGPQLSSAKIVAVPTSTTSAAADTAAVARFDRVLMGRGYHDALSSAAHARASALRIGA